MPYNSAAAGERTKFIEVMADTVARRKAEGHVVMAVGATTLRDSPTSSRGFRRRGGKDAVRTNYPKCVNHLIGELGDGAPDTRFHKNLTADSLREPLVVRPLALQEDRRHHTTTQRSHRQNHAGTHRRNERGRQEHIHPAPRPAAQSHKDAVTGDQGRRYRRLLRRPGRDAGRHSGMATQQGDVDGQIVWRIFTIPNSVANSRLNLAI